MASRPIFLFRSPYGGLNFVIIREDNKYYLAFGCGYYGHCPTRMSAHLNPTTARETPRCLPNGHPCIWLEPQTHSPNPNRLDELVEQLLTAQPRPPVKLTGGKMSIGTTDRIGIQPGRDAREAIVLLSEDELAHCCYYCGWPEVTYGEDPEEGESRYKKIGGEGYRSTYACCDCLEKSFFTRSLT
ncbi:hypothetical protein B0H11DRAFT_1826169, partial [Mycena galericulata]